MKRFTLLTIYAVLGFAITLNAQQKNPKRFYIEDSNKKFIQLPFKLINNLIVLPVFVNNSDTLNFILDSGISNTLITDRDLATSLDLHYTREIKMYGFGGGEALSAFHSIENNIRIPGILGQHQDLLVIPSPDFDFSKLLGIKIHGLLGYNVFRDLIIEINYDSKNISFHTPKTYQYKNKKRATTFPLTIIDTKPFLTTSIIQEDSSEVEGRFLIDSGASFALWIDMNSNKQFLLPTKTEKLYLGTSLSGAVYGRVGRIKELGAGKAKVHNVIASYSDTTMIPSQFSDNRNGTIGADILSRFNVIFDYRNSKITFLPNSKTKDPFQVNLSGMEICCPTPGENLFSISNICQDSPAHKAGLQPGDQIMNINYQELSKLDLSEVHAMLLKKAGKKMTIHYKRNGEIFSAILIMRESI